MELSLMTIDELDEALVRMASDERADLRRFLEHLIEFNRKDGALRKAYPSLFIYCRNRLRLSEGETCRRTQAAYKASEFPQLLDHIESGALNLTLINLLAPHLDKRNADELINSACGKSTRDLEAYLAARTPPQTPLKDVIRFTPPTAPDPLSLAPEPLFQTQTPSSSFAAPAADATATPSATSPGRPSVRIAFTASPALLGKIERARGLLRHKYPDARLEQLFDEAVEALLDRIDRSRKDKPALAKPVLPGRRRVPEWVKDLVFARDGGRCAFESVDGKRCEASEWLEYDHVTPFAFGGRSDDPENVRLLCRAHNQLRARDDFGAPAESGAAARDGEQGELWSGDTFSEDGSAKDVS